MTHTIHNEATAPRFELHLFGPFQATFANHPVNTFRSDKVRALLAYLVLEGTKPIPRMQLIKLLWGGYNVTTARSSLRTALHNLRQLLAPLALLQVTPQTVKFAAHHPHFWCDALALDALWAAQPTPQQVEAVVNLDLDQRPFLQGLEKIDSPSFQAWRQAQSDHYQQILAQLANKLHRSNTLAHNLPRALTSFIGRRSEIDTLQSQLLAPARLITLVGEGGVGKTRLALALAEKVQFDFVDGVWFVPLAGLTPNASTTANELAAVVGAAMQLQFGGTASLATQLRRLLQTKQCLLILDSFEHLAHLTPFVQGMLDAVPGCQMLVTSRHQLALPGEVVLRVHELAVPETPEVTKQLTSGTFKASYWLAWESIQLFGERASHVAENFMVDADNVLDIVRICQLVGGLPLGIELAAALLETQTCAEIAQSVQANYGVLAAELRDLPLRHRSARAALLASWQLLTKKEAQTLLRCAVFQGGFTAKAAQTVAAAAPPILQALVHKSLLRQVNGERYDMHRLVRQFAAELLADAKDEAQSTQARHVAYYMNLLANWPASVNDEREFQRVIQPDLENVQMAWTRAVEQGQLELLTKALEGLSQFYHIAGFYATAEATFSRTVSHLRHLLVSQTDPQKFEPLLAQVLLKLCMAYTALAQSTQGRRIGEEVIEWAMHLGDAKLEVEAYCELGYAAWVQGDYLHQQRTLEKGLLLAQQHGFIEAQARCLSGLGLSAQAQHDYTAALSALHSGLELAWQAQNRALQAMLLNNLGIVYRDIGDFSQAAHYLQQNLTLIRQTGRRGKIAIATANLGALALLLGDFPQARAYLEEGLHSFAEQGEKRPEAECLALLAILFEQMDDVENGSRYCERTIELASQHHYYHPHREAWITLGHLHLRQKQLNEALAAYQQANQLSENAGVAEESLQGQACRAAVLLLQNEKAQAMALVEKVLHHFDPTRFNLFQSPQGILLTCYHVLAANADPRASEVLEQAWQLLQTQAAKISHAALRQSFLQNLPINRDLVWLNAEKPLTVPTSFTENGRKAPSFSDGDDALRHEATPAKLTGCGR